MNKTELRQAVIETGSHYFDRKTMKFFGDTMKNFEIMKTSIINNLDEEVEVYELFRRRPVKHGLKDSAYFNAATFKREFKKS